VLAAHPDDEVVEAGVFPPRVKRFWPASRYAFRAPPRRVELFYEQMRWVSGEDWGAHASSVPESPGFEESPCL